MFSEKKILIEFPADSDYIPFIQVFLRDFLKELDFGEDFSEKAAAESSQWFHSIIPDEKILHALPTVSFSCKYSEQGIEAQIQTTDDKKFTISLNRQSAENAI